MKEQDNSRGSIETFTQTCYASYILLTYSSGSGKPERGKGTDVRIKLERPHDHQSSSVSQPHPGINWNLPSLLPATFELPLLLCIFMPLVFFACCCWCFVFVFCLFYWRLCIFVCRTVSSTHMVVSWISIFRLDFPQHIQSTDLNYWQMHQIYCIDIDCKPNDVCAMYMYIYIQVFSI